MSEQNGDLRGEVVTRTLKMTPQEFELLGEFSRLLSSPLNHVGVRLHASGPPSDAFLATWIGMLVDVIRCLLETHAKEWARDTDRSRMIADYLRWSSQSHFIKAEDRER